MTEFEDRIQNTGEMMIDPKENQIFQDIYSGPWIEKRIEYKSSDDKSHEIIIFGSWNGFRQGEEMERLGRQNYGITIKLPTGSWVYRFQIDKGDWETNNETAKTIKDGIEYNTITIKEKDDSEEEEIEEKNEDKKDKQLKLIFDESCQKFVVGKKKRHGRPSMELDLGKDFDDAMQPQEAEEAEDDDDEDIPQEHNVDIDAIAKSEAVPAMGTTLSNAVSTDGKSRNRNKNDKKKRKKRKMVSQKHLDKEVSRKVFVEQLRQQQLHEDEINRVKLLWKQERQVRVEMHKKIVKEKKKLSQDVIQLQSEIERLQNIGKIGNFNENKQIQHLEADKKKIRN